MRPSPLPLAFAAFGILWGAWQAALFDLAAHYGLSSGPLGAVLTAGFALSLPAMLLTGRLMDRLGARLVTVGTAVVMAIGLLAVGTLPPLPGLVVAIVVLVTGSGAYDVAINGSAMGHATWSRPARLTLLHAAFSGGGMVGAIAAGAILGAGIGFTVVYPLIAGVLVVAALLAARTDEGAATSEGAEVPPALARAMLPLAALAALAFLAEGTMETWSGIYLRDELGAAAFIGALGPGAFHAAMLAGRLLGAGVAGSLGAPTTLLVAGTATLLGMALALAAPAAGVAIAGTAIAALGASFIVPVVVSLASGRAGPLAGRAASYVLSLGYAGFLIGPSMVGLLGEVAGLRVALLVVPVAAAIVVVASRLPLAREAR